MVGRFTDRLWSSLVELRAQARLRAWTLGYEFEMRRQSAAHEQRNLTCAGYCVLLSMLDAVGSPR